MNDLIISVAAFALGVFIYFYSNSFALEGGVSENPAYYPQILAVMLIVLAVALFIRTLRVRDSGRIEITQQGGLAVLCGLGMLVAYVIVLDIIGFILATGIFVLCCLFFFGAGKKLSLGLFIPITAAVYVVFGILLNIPVPMGIFMG